MHALRANAIPETAWGLSWVLLSLFGVIQYALVGFAQIGADGAAFVGTHATVAEYGNPDSTKSNYAQQVALAVFPHAVATYTASVPKNGTYEVRVSNDTMIPKLTSLFPSASTTRSRIVEPSQSTVNVNAPPGQCALGAEKLVNGATTIVSGKAVDLVQGTLTNPNASGLFKTINDSNGNTALSLDQGTLLAHLSALNTISSNLSATATDLRTIGNALNSPLLLGLGQGVAQQISTQISPILQLATNGSLSQGVSAGNFAAQVTASTNAIQNVEKSNLLNSLLTQTFSTVIDPLLYGTAATPGILTGGPNGGLLTQVNNAENTLFVLDQNAPAACP